MKITFAQLLNKIPVKNNSAAIKSESCYQELIEFVLAAKEKKTEKLY